MCVCVCVCVCVRAAVRACACVWVGVYVYVLNRRNYNVIITIYELFSLTICIQGIHICMVYIVDIDECADNPCHSVYNVSCEDKVNDFKCECHTCSCSNVTVKKDCTLGKLMSSFPQCTR